jgi:beta-glucosidase
MKRRLTQSQKDKIQGLISRMTLEEKCSQLSYESKPIDRFGIEEYNWWNECLHGVARAGRATIFPQAIGMAATFDVQLVKRVAEAIALEARAKHHYAASHGNRGQYRGLTFWTPNINIFRDPRWGRGMETYGEDPFLTSRMGVAFVEGLQGDEPEYLKAAACAKHYAVHSGPESLRHEFDARVSEKDLRETYLPAFEALIEAGVETVMGAYNRVNGEPANAHPYLIGEILRGEWGFQGHFVSDCWAIKDFHTGHNVTKTVEESAALALRSGCDLNCGDSYEQLKTAVEQGLVEEKFVDESLARLLRTRLLLGLLDDENPNPLSATPISVVGSNEHRALARELAAQSVVLLKNEGNLLPLSPNVKRLYVTGPNAASIEALIGNYYGVSEQITTILEGVSGSVDESTTIDYRKGALVDRKNTNPVDWITFEASKADAAIAVFGNDNTIEGEEGDAIASENKGDRRAIELPAHQVDTLKKFRAGGAKVILVLTGGSPIAFPEDLADSILFAWYPGQEGGAAVADIIFGRRSPGGRLPITFPRSTDDLPPYEDYSMRNRTYRFSDQEPLFPFGFGLSYAPVSYGPVSLQKVGDSEKGETSGVVASVTISNTGERPIEEVAQAYLRRRGASASAPRWSLCGFSRVSIGAGKSVPAEIEIPHKCFSFFDEEGRRQEPRGTYEILVGGSSPGPRSEELGAVFAETVSIDL